MSIPLKEMKQRVNNKYSVLPLVCSYQYLNEYKADCIFYELSEDDDENDYLAKKAEDSLITLFGSEHFRAFNTVSPFLNMSFEEEEKTHNNISEYWRTKIKAYVSEYLQSEQYVANGYFFMLIPKSI